MLRITSQRGRGGLGVAGGALTITGGRSVLAPNVETTAWQASVAAAGGTLTTAQFNAVDALITAAKAHGYWTKLLDVAPLAGSNLAAGLVKLKAYTGTGSALTNTGFVAGDYSATAGFQGGAGKSLDHGFNYQTYGTGVRLGYSFFVNDEFVPTATEGYAGHDYGNGPPFLGAFSISPSGPGYGVTFLHDAGTTFSTSRNGAVGRGLYHYARPSLSQANVYLNGVKVGSDTSTVTDGSANVTHRAMAGYGGVLLHRGSFFAIDDGTLSDAQAAAYAADVTQLQRALGRIVPAAAPLRYVPLIGQSNATASGSASALSTAQPYSNRFFSSYQANNPDGAFARAGLVPMIEVGGETSASGMANLTAALWRADHADDASRDVLVGNHATGGADYNYLRKGGNGTNYVDSLAAATFAKGLANDYGAGLLVPYVVCIHGESDAQSTTYQADLTQWQADYEADFQTLTEQSAGVPMLVCQPSAWTAGVPGGASGTATAKSQDAMLAAHVANPGKIVLTAPSYIFPYGSGSDGVHLTAAGKRWRGEYFAKAADQLNRGQAWSPLRPASVQRSGAVITIPVTGAVGNLALDTTRVTNPGDYGFDVRLQADNSPLSIASVSLDNTGSTKQVIITLTANPGGSGVGVRVGYARVGTINNAGGPTSGPRGNLRDSDATASLNGNDLSNWMVHFDLAAA